MAGTPRGTPQLSTHPGLTPQMPITNADGTPTTFFFRWLLTINGAALASQDLELLEAFDRDPGAAVRDALQAAEDLATLAGFPSAAALAEAMERESTAQIAAAIESGGASARNAPASEDRFLEAFAAAPAPGLSESIGEDQRFLENLMAAPAPVADAPPSLIADTLANWTLANYNPANYATGQQFLVTTWQVTYTVEAGVWTYTSGVYVAPAASRPATGFNGAALGASDTGLRFLARDTGVYEYWNGAAWTVIAAPPAAAEVTTPFTPQLSFGGSTAGITYSTQYGTSSVVGHLVTIVINIILTSKGSASGSAEITGIPVAASAGSSVGVPLYAGMAGITSIVAQLIGGSAQINLYNAGATTVAGLTDANFTNGSVLQFSITYTT
jgi:hypothetical protein